MNKFLLAGLMLMLLQPQVVQAYGEMHDEQSLELKGFSVETSQAVQAMVNRMEGREAPAVPDYKTQLKYNLLNNEWAASKEPFTYDKMDAPKYPKRPSPSL